MKTNERRLWYHAKVSNRAIECDRAEEFPQSLTMNRGLAGVPVTRGARLHQLKRIEVLFRVGQVLLCSADS